MPSGTGSPLFWRVVFHKIAASARTPQGEGKAALPAWGGTPWCVGALLMWGDVLVM